MADETTLDPDRMYVKVVAAGNDWADHKAAYEALDDVTKSVLAEIGAPGADETRAAAEQRALRSDRYRNHLSEVAAARKAYLRAQVAYDGLKMLVELRRSVEATRRAETRLT